MKNILLNGLLLNNQYGGVQYSIEYFIEALASLEVNACKFTVLLSNDYNGILVENRNLNINKVSFSSSDRAKRIFFEHYHLPKYFSRNGFDLYHSPAYILPYFSPIPNVLTVHDLIALDFPELCKKETALYFSLCLPRSIRNASKIIAISEVVKKDILNRFPDIDESKVELIYHGVHQKFKRVTDQDQLTVLKLKYSLPEKFILFIGNIEPKKNLLKVIEAFACLKKDSEFDHKLVIAGQKGWKFDAIFDAAANVACQNDIIFSGYVDDQDISGLYTLADVFLFPSLYEGFGMPVLEAMACGCAVIVSDRGSLPEVSGGYSPIVNPDDSDQIASAVRKVISNSNYKDNLVKQGYLWSRNFTWTKTAEKTAALYATLLGTKCGDLPFIKQ